MILKNVFVLISVQISLVLVQNMCWLIVILACSVSLQLLQKQPFATVET